MHKNKNDFMFVHICYGTHFSHKRVLWCLAPLSNNISVILVEETRVPGENNRPVATH
jgi:hypothetical protein